MPFGHPKPNISIRLLMLIASRTDFNLISHFGSSIILSRLPDFIYILSRKQRKKEWQPCIFFFMELSNAVSLHDIKVCQQDCWNFYSVSGTATWLLRAFCWLHSTRWDELLSRKMKNSISYLFETLVIILSLAKQNSHQPTFSVMFCLLQA